MNTTTEAVREILSATDTVAIAKAIGDKMADAAKGALAVGRHDIDLTVRIRGTVTKGEDYPQDIVAKAQPWALLAVVLNKLNGITIDSIVREADTIAAGAVDEVKDATDRAIAAIKNKTTTICKGKVTAKLVVERV
jgi:hypothetical protein